MHKKQVINEVSKHMRNMQVIIETKIEMKQPRRSLPTRLFLCDY